VSAAKLWLPLQVSKAFIFTDKENNQTTYFYCEASSKFQEFEPGYI